MSVLLSDLIRDEFIDSSRHRTQDNIDALSFGIFIHRFVFVRHWTTSKVWWRIKNKEKIHWFRQKNWSIIIKNELIIHELLLLFIVIVIDDDDDERVEQSSEGQKRSMIVRFLSVSTRENQVRLLKNAAVCRDRVCLTTAQTHQCSSTGRLLQSTIKFDEI